MPREGTSWQEVPRGCPTTTGGEPPTLIRAHSGPRRERRPNTDPGPGKADGFSTMESSWRHFPGARLSLRLSAPSCPGLSRTYSGSDESDPSTSVWKLSVHVFLKPSLKDLEHYHASMGNESNFMVV